MCGRLCCRLASKGRLRKSTPDAEDIHEIQIIEEVDRAITVKIRGGKVAGKRIHKIEVVEEINPAIEIEFRHAGNFEFDEIERAGSISAS